MISQKLLIPGATGAKVKIGFSLMKQFPSFLSVGKLISFSSIKGSCGFWKGERRGLLKAPRMNVKHTAALGSLSLPIVWPFTWVFSFSLSNLFPYIIMTQRRVVTLQTPFGWILMRDLNHWQMGAFCMAGCGGGGAVGWEATHRVCLARALSWRSLYLSRHTHEEFSNIKVGWWSGGGEDYRER